MVFTHSVTNKMEEFNIMEFYKSFSGFDDLTAELKRYHIYIKKNDDGRILFEGDLNDTSIPYSPIRSLLKGVVIDTIDEKLLAVPSNPVRYSETVTLEFMKNILSNNNGIFYAEDGTTVTLYRFDGIINLASSNGIDISGFKWNTPNTISELLYESLEASAGNYFMDTTKIKLLENKVLSWDVPEGISLTVGFHNSKIHPSCESNKVWFMDCRDLTTGKPSTEFTNDYFKLPLNNGINQEDRSRLGIVEEDFDAQLVLDRMIYKCNRDVFIDHSESFYGYIIVDDKAKVFVPSQLYRTLRHVLYSDRSAVIDSAQSESNRTDPRWKDRYKYNLLLTAIENKDSNSIDIFRKFSPEFKNYITNCMSVFEIIELYVKLDLGLTTFDTGRHKNSSTPDMYCSLVSRISSEILTNEPDIRKNINKANERHVVNVIKSFMYKRDYIKDLLVLCNKNI